MNRFLTTVALLKKYGYLTFCIVDLLLAFLFAAYGIYIQDLRVSAYYLFFLPIVGWTISDVYLYRELDSYRSQFDDKCDETVLLEGNIRRMEEELAIYKALATARKENPIKSNRIVSDKTFAVRLKSFAQNTRCNDQMSQEESEYLTMVAERLLKWQTRTVRKDSNEYKYLENLGLMPKPSASTDGHNGVIPKEDMTEKRTASRKKSKTEKSGDENKD